MKKEIYKEDLFQQPYFDLEDWRKAKFKYPINFWFRSKYTLIKDFLKELKIRISKRNPYI